MLDQKTLFELFEYDSVTGIFVWKTRPLSHFKSKSSAKTCNTRMAGKPVGTIDGRGYYHVNVWGKFYRLHRLAWVYVYGEQPNGIVDHIDRNPLNNAITNLRLTDNTGNNLNRSANKNAVSRYKGVSRHTHGRWQAQTKIKGKPYHLGLFDTEKDASDAYVEFMRSIHGKEFFE